jgi:hypothetical protein
MCEIERIVQLIIKLYIIINATNLGWQVLIENEQIILSKKIDQLTSLDHDTSQLVNALICHDYPLNDYSLNESSLNEERIYENEIYENEIYENEIHYNNDNVIVNANSNVSANAIADAIANDNESVIISNIGNDKEQIVC